MTDSPVLANLPEPLDTGNGLWLDSGMTTSTISQINPGFEFAQIAAHLNRGRIVRLTTNRGLVVEGELHTVGHASCYVGTAGRFAYGGIADIREVEG